MKNLLILCACVIFLMGCATQTYYLNDNSAAEPKVEKSQAFFIGGIGQESELNAAKICGNAGKVAKVQSKKSFLDGLLLVITFGLYSPNTATVYCTK